MATKFVSVPVDVAGHTLHVDGNSKVSGWADPKPNAFSLPAPGTCPGATSTCLASCYTEGLRCRAPAVAATYHQNERAVHAILNGFDPGWAAFEFGRWIAANAPPIGFRWHVSGDVFSLPYADWIVRVCQASLNVRHWIYTRSLWAVGHLVKAENLAVNVSCDRDNWAAARAVTDLYDARLCYLARADDAIPDLPDGSVIFPHYEIRGRTDAGQAWAENLDRRLAGMVCVADWAGQSKDRNCEACGRCIRPLRKDPS